MWLASVKGTIGNMRSRGLKCVSALGFGFSHSFWSPAAKWRSLASLIMRFVWPSCLRHPCQTPDMCVGLSGPFQPLAYTKSAFSVLWGTSLSPVLLLKFSSLLKILAWWMRAQLCSTLCDPMDCSPPDSSAHGNFQARILQWVAISFSRGSSQPRDWTRVFHIVGRCFTVWATREVYKY